MHPSLLNALARFLTKSVAIMPAESFPKGNPIGLALSCKRAVLIRQNKAGKPYIENVTKSYIGIMAKRWKICGDFMFFLAPSELNSDSAIKIH
jgi:hypothetical protein